MERNQGLAIVFVLVMVSLPIVIVLVLPEFWRIVFLLFILSFSTVASVLLLWQGLVKKEGGRVLLQAKIHSGDRLILILIDILLFFSASMYLIPVVFTPLTWTVIYSIPILLLGFYNFFKARSKLEFTEEGIRYFNNFVRWEKIKSWSWTGLNYDYLTLSLKRAVVIKWRIDPEDGQAVSDFVYQRVAVLQNPNRHGLQPE